MLIKLTVAWFLCAYTVDTLMNSYKTITHENTFTEMKEYMYHCQKREDKLREHCYLQMYRIPQEHTFVENLMDKYYTLKRVGVKASPTYSYANQQYERYPQNPIWTIQLGNRVLTITTVD